MCVFFIILYHYENIGHYSLRCFVAFYLGVCVCKPGSQQPRESWPVQGSILQAEDQTEFQSEKMSQCLCVMGGSLISAVLCHVGCLA